LIGQAGKFTDELKVFIDVQHGEPDEFGSGGNQQIGDGRPAVLADVREHYCGDI
jgi:hypothetical protein